MFDASIQSFGKVSFERETELNLFNILLYIIVFILINKHLFLHIQFVLECKVFEKGWSVSPC